MKYKNLFVYDSLEQLNEDAAKRIIELASRAISDRSVFRIALAGGSTPRGLYKVLSSEKYRKQVDWRRWEFYFSDERLVARDDQRSNFAMAKEALFGNEDHNVYSISDDISDPSKVAKEYESLIRKNFLSAEEEVPTFDLILLGVGSDGHTASLFPGKPALNITDRLVIESTPGVLPPDVDRMTFTLPLINAAQHVMFLVSGKDKEEAFRAAYLGQPLGSEEVSVPASLVLPTSGTLEWLVTSDVSGKL